MTRKKIENSIVNVLLFVFLAVTLAFTSCDENKKEIADNTETEIVTDANLDSDTETEEIEEKEESKTYNNIPENEVRTRTYKMKEAQPLVYNVDAYGIAGFDDWSDYTVVNYELADMKRNNFITTKDRISLMNYRVANLSNTIPSWLKTEEVMEDVADIQKEYLELIKDTDASENEIKENLEELSEKFDDLKEELDETVAEYVKIHEEAIEEFNEEISKGKIEAAIEEYEEEIKKMNKIVEKK